MLSALQLVNIMKQTGKPLSELASEMETYPQSLVNVEVVDKHRLFENARIQDVIERVEKRLGEEGRVLVRPSGTEPLVRIMVEAQEQEQCQECVQEIATVVQSEMGVKK